MQSRRHPHQCPTRRSGSSAWPYLTTHFLATADHSGVDHSGEGKSIWGPALVHLSCSRTHGAVRGKHRNRRHQTRNQILRRARRVSKGSKRGQPCLRQMRTLALQRSPVLRSALSIAPRARLRARRRSWSASCRKVLPVPRLAACHFDVAQHSTNRSPRCVSQNVGLGLYLQEHLQNTPKRGQVSPWHLAKYDRATPRAISEQTCGFSNWRSGHTGLSGATRALHGTYTQATG